MFRNLQQPKKKEDMVLKKVKNEISNLRPLSARRNTKTRKNDSNPFSPPDVTDVFAEVDANEQLRRQKLKDNQKLKLSQRQMLPSQVTSQRAIRERIEKRFKTDADDEEKLDNCYERRPRQQHTSEMITEQREVFLCNLLIDRHKKELERLNYLKRTKKGKLEELELALEEEQNRSRTVSRQLEMQKNREKFHLDDQLKRRRDIESKLSKKKVIVGELNNELLVLEQKRDSYKLCKELQDEMESYYGLKLTKYKEFVEVFDRMEQDNLFLIKNKKQMESKAEGKSQDMKDEIEKLKKDNEVLSEELRELKAKKDAIQKIPETTQDTTELDAKLSKLQKLISKTYQKCFGTTDATQNSITMLSLIEANIETMLKKLSSITDKDWVAKQIKQLNSERRKQLREANAAKKERDQEAKKKAMIERATKPVKRRTGRPVIERIVSGPAKKVNTAKLEAERDERERLDQLLFGDSIFD